MLRVKEVSELLNIPISKIHYYEKEGLIKPVRGENLYRYYSEEDISYLKFAIVMKRIGLSIPEIKKIIFNYRTSESDPDVYHDSQTFFENEIKERQKKIEKEKLIISILQNLPLFDNYSLEKKRILTKNLIDKLYKHGIFME